MQYWPKLEEIINLVSVFVVSLFAAVATITLFSRPSLKGNCLLIKLLIGLRNFFYTSHDIFLRGYLYCSDIIFIEALILHCHSSFMHVLDS